MDGTGSGAAGGGGGAATNTTTNNSTAATPQSQNTPHQNPPPQQQQQQAALTPQTTQEVDRIVLNYLNQKGYRQAEYMLKREAKIMTLEEMQNSVPPPDPDGINPGYAMYDRAEMDNPEAYNGAYQSLQRWVENSLDLYKPELVAVMYPMFVHSYLDLVSKGFKEQAKKFLDAYKSDHLELHSPDITRLATITDAQHVKENELAKTYRGNKYHLQASKVSFELLIAFLDDNKFMVLLRIVNQYLNIHVGARTGDADEVVGIVGYGMHQLKDFNQQKVLLGQVPPDAGLREQVEQTLKDDEPKPDNEAMTDVQPSPLMEEFKKIRTETPGLEAPTREDIPLPLFKGSDVQAEIDALRDSRKRAALSPSTLPSICAYTFHNTHGNLNCVTVSEDATLMAAGFSESYVRLWSLEGKELKGMRSDFNPALVNDSKDLEDLKDKTGSESKKLIGHAGPVFGASFSHDNKYLITCSEDKTARLWSTSTFTNLVCYKGHNYPVWDVDFGPQGFYFATASHDRTARLWSCDHIYPLRIFAGHLSDVDAVKFHPNSKYLVTGSSDKTARLWDVQRGSCVRVFTGHSGAVHALAVSPDGRLMASAGEDKSIQLWDLGSGKRMKKMTGHQGVIYSLDFSKDGSTLVSGSADCTVRVWDVKKDTTTAQSVRVVGATADSPTAIKSSPSLGSPRLGSPTSASANGTFADKQHKKALLNGHAGGVAGGLCITESDDHLASFPTKRTPIYKVQFTRRNLCLAVGAFPGN